MVLCIFFFFYVDLGLIVLGALGERICNQSFCLIENIHVLIKANQVR